MKREQIEASWLKPKPLAEELELMNQLQGVPHGKSLTREKDFVVHTKDIGQIATLDQRTKMFMEDCVYAE